MGTALATLSLASLGAGLALGIFGPAKRLSFEMEAYTSLETADLDGDGDLDVLSASNRDDKIVWFRNNSGGSFSDELQIATGIEPTGRSVRSADMDGDGDLDVMAIEFAIVSSDPILFEYRVVWYEQGAALEGWTRHLVSASAESVDLAVPVDLNGDQTVDLAWVGESDSGGMELAWRPGTGGGAFGAKILLDTSPASLNQLGASDLDGDGDSDLIVSFEFDAFGGDNVRWYENLGSGTFASQQLVSFGVGNITDLAVGDLLGDSLPDVLLASDEQGLVAIENLGDSGFAPATLVAPEPFAITFSSAALTDLDGDLDLDVLAGAFGSSSRVYWFENRGDGSFQPQRPLTEDLVGSVLVDAGDLDADGDVEVVAACAPFLIGSTAGRILWFENSTDPAD
ncbi:MAG: FG-GAP repeat domain-containing protein [Planctomycetota bacterium]